MIDLGAALGLALSRVIPVQGSTLAGELFEERAAIMEYDGGLTREEAERQAGYSLYPACPESNYQDMEK